MGPNKRILTVAVAIIAGIALLTIGVGVANGQDDGGDVGTAVVSPEYSNIHGSACQPANLGQSINYKTAWTGQGIRNTQPLGSGKNFYVVCPVIEVDDGGTQPGADVFVQLRYQDRTATDRVSCTAHRLFAGSAGYVKTVTASDMAAGTGSYFGVLELPDLVLDSQAGFDGIYDSAVVICALVPQAAISGIVFDSD
jgi:hypothetical protein